MEHNMSVTTGMSASLDFTVTEDTLNTAWDLLLGARPAKPTHAVMIERQISLKPQEPVKGAPLVGKQYRMARRKWVRRMRRGIRNGWPKATVREYFPAATLTAGPITDDAGGVSYEMTLGQAAR